MKPTHSIVTSKQNPEMISEKKDRKLFLAILVLDIALLIGWSSLVFYLFEWFAPATTDNLSWKSTIATLTFSFIASFAIYPSVAQHRITNIEEIISRITKTCILFTLFAIALTVFIRPAERFPRTFFITLITTFPLVLFIERLIIRKLLMHLRKRKRNLKSVILIGKDATIIELFQTLQNPIYGYNIAGVFFDGTCNDQEYASKKVSDCAGIYNWIKAQEGINELYASTSDLDKSSIRQINKYCDNNLIRFYQVPSIVTPNKDVTLTMKDRIAVISSRNEPLADPINQTIKRAFDFITSSLFLLFIYPFIYVIIALIIKKTSPGPIYFKQERTGMNGKVFKCIKFRSMKVNNDADTLQATKNDPRKYPFGDFMRKTNIDELPQIINVWKGEMSFVGPRPHMLKHTDEYSHLINKYMVRHLAKPGITGLAQVSGFRGETQHIEQMEGRVRKDIEYIENWSFWLDIRIILKTVTNMIVGDKNAY